MDGDRAAEDNKRGFSKGDTADGHFLANIEVFTVVHALAGRRLIRRYGRQLSRETLAAALEVAA
jgi:hypothetical protein